MLDEPSFFLKGTGLGAGFDDVGFDDADLDDDGFTPEGGGARLGVVDGVDGALVRVGGASAAAAGASFGVDAGVA